MTTKRKLCLIMFTVIFLFNMSTYYSQSLEWINYTSGFDDINALLSYGDLLYVGGNGLTEININTGEKKFYNKANSNIPSMNVSTLAYDSSNVLWVGTSDAGLAGLNNNKWELYTVKNSNFPSDTVTVIDIDKYNNIWVGTDKGLVKFNSANKELSIITDLGSAKIYNILHDDDNNVYVGTEFDVKKYDGDKWTSINNGSYLLESIDNSGNLYFKKDLYSYNNKTIPFYDGNELKFLEPEISLAENWTIQSFLIDDNNTFWIGIKIGDTSFGLLMFDGSNWTLFDETISTNKGNSFQFLSSISLDANKNIWVGLRYFGLYKFDGLQWSFNQTGNSSLPTNDILSIAIDKQNVKWIGTRNGLLKIEKDNWTLFDSSLTDVNIFDIKVDNDNTVWLCTSEGLYSIQNNNLKHYSNQTYGNFITTFDIDSQGNIFASNELESLGSDAYIRKFDGETWRTMPAPNNLGFVQDIVIDDNDYIYVGTMFSGLFIFNGSEWKNIELFGETKYYINHIILGENNEVFAQFLQGALLKFINGEPVDLINTQNSLSIITSAFDDSRNLWLGTTDGLFSLGETNIYRTSNSGLSSNDITSLAFEENGICWIGTFSSGLSIFKRNIINLFDDNNSGLPDNDINYLYLDATDTLWVGTRDGFAKKVDTGWVSYTDITMESIYAIIEDNSKNKYFGTLDGLFKYDDKSWEKIIFPNGIISSVWSLAVDNYDTLWVGLWLSGIAKFFEDKWVSLYRPDNSPLPDNQVSCILIDKNNNKWIGTPDGGLAKLNDNGWEIFNKDNSIIPSNYISSIIEDHLGNIWIGTREGLVKYNNNSWSIYDTINSPLLTNSITCIAKSKNNNLWIGLREGGIAKFDGIDWGSINISNSPLPTNNITSIVVDSENKIWVGTDSYGVVSIEERGVITRLEDKPIVHNYNLFQNYPNPFNPLTKIRYELPTNQKVKIDVYDILGRSVVTLVNEFKSQGTHEVSFNAENLPSGVYFYRIISNEYAAVKKMLVIK